MAMGLSRQLSEKLCIKTGNYKWKNDRGLPDILILKHFRVTRYKSDYLLDDGTTLEQT